jgi:hypothetical protein
VTVHRVFQHLPMHPEDIELVECAFELALDALRLVDRADPATNLVAKVVVEVYQTGIRDPEQVAKLTVRRLGPD